MESHKLKELPFCIILGKKQMKKFFKKMQNTIFWGPLCPNLAKNEFFTKIALCHFSASIVP